MEFSLMSTQDLAVLMLPWGTRRPIELDEFGEWRYLTAIPGLSVEQLQEKFNWINIPGKTCRFESSRVVLSQATLLFPTYCSLAVVAARSASPPP